jgi:hypothetical protein
MTNTAKPVKKEKKLGAKLEKKTTLQAQRPLLIVR